MAATERNTKVVIKETGWGMAAHFGSDYSLETVAPAGTFTTKGNSEMLTPLALFDLPAILTTRAALPVTGGLMAGFAVAFFRGSLGQRLGLFGNRESDSLMNFSSMGTLRCICGTSHPEGVSLDRRQICRSCGCEVVASNTTMLDKQLTHKEIKAMTASLRKAAIRASHLELPPTITTIEELHRYLDSSEAKTPRMPPPSNGSTTSEQHRVH